jgi:hypothetical protein
MNEITAHRAVAAPDMSHAPALTFRELQMLATSIATSGLFGMKTPDQAMSLMMIAQAEGRHPALAARDYDVIQGRPAKKAEAMQRDFMAAGGKIEWHTLSDERADATFSHPQGGSVRIEWDMPRAKKAGLLGKDMYSKFPRQMLRSRTISEGVRTVWPLATSGLYVPEEAADMAPPPHREPPHAGPTIDATPEPATAEGAPRKATVADWLDARAADFGAAQTRDGVDAILARDDVQKAMDGALRNGGLARLKALIAEAIQRTSGTDEDGPDGDLGHAEAEAEGAA